MPEFEDYYVIQGGAEGGRDCVCSAVSSDRRRTSLLARLGVASGWACLDVGCGGGDVALKLATLAHPATVVGIDADGPHWRSPAMGRRCRLQERRVPDG